MELRDLLSGSRYEGIESIDDLARVQHEKFIQDRGALPPRPHSLPLPFSTPAEATSSMAKFEQTTTAFVDAATALCEAISPAWEAAHMQKPGDKMPTCTSRWQDIFSRYGLRRSQSSSWQNALPYGINNNSARKTNCYGYAINRAKLMAQQNMGHDIHPGELAGLEYWDRDAPVKSGRELYAELELPVRSATVYNVLRKALADGLSLEPVEGGYPVYFALAADDYHWYRQDRTGYWSHKPGHNAVRNRDGDGTSRDRLITNPMTANRLHGYTRYGQGGCFLWVSPELNNRSSFTIYEPMNLTRPRKKPSILGSQFFRKGAA